jgi:putative integral membrane protein mviN
MSSNTPRRSILRASALMASGTMVSRILGFVRNAMLIAAVGATAGGVGAAFQTANTLPNTVFNLLASGIFDAVLVPQIVGAIKRRHDGDTYVNHLLTLAGTLLFLVTFATMVLAPVLVMITAAGYTEDIRNLAILFALLCLPQLFFYGLYNLLGELLNAREIFGPYMWAPVVNNVVGIAGLGAFLAIWGGAPDGGIPAGDLTGAQFWVLAGSATLGVICQALCLLWPMRRAGVSFKPDFHFRGTSFGSIPRVAGWTFATLGVSQVGVLSTNNLAAMADGFIGRNGAQGGVVGILAYSTAFMIFMVPQSLITVSLTTAIFTRMAGAVADGDDRAVADNYHLGVRTITSLTLVAAAMLMAGSVPMMEIAMAAKGGDPEAVTGYALVLASLMPGVASTGMVLMSQRVFFAYEDVKPVFLMGIGPTLIQVIVGWSMYALTGARWWVVAAALGETVCRLTQGIIAVVWVSRENRYVDRAGLLRSYASYLAAAIVAGLVGFGLLRLMGIHTEISSTLGRMALAGVKLSLVSALTGLVYLLVLRLAAPGESAVMMRPLLTRLRVPSAVVNILAASSTPTPASAEIMTEHTPDETEETMAPTPERTGDDESLPSFDEVLSASPIPAPPAADAADAAEELADMPPTPAPAEVPTLDTATQAPIENPLVAEAVAAPIVDDITEAAEAAQAQAIPESLADYGIEPVTDEVDAAQVEAPTFPLAPPPPAPAASGYERVGEVSPEDYPHPAPLTDGPATHQIPRVQAPEEVPAPPVEDATEVMDPVPPMPVAPAQDAPASANEDGSSKRSGTLIDPTKPALIFGVFLVLFGAIWGPWMATRPVTDLDLAQSLRAGISQQQSDEEPSPALTTTPPPSPTTTPVISSVQVLSWNNDDGDHPDRAINMIDSNPSTSWSSRWFDNNQFRDETSVTIVVKLQQKATVSSVTLNMDPATSGGELVVRNVTDPANPRGGTELAKSALSPTTTIQLPTPVETDSIALQFHSMPKGQDGRNWAWISELTVQ